LFGKKRNFKTLYLVVGLAIVFFLFHRFVFSFSRLCCVVVSTVSYPVFLVQEKIISPIRNYSVKKKQSKEIDQFLNQLIVENERLLAENIALHAAADYQEQTQELIQFKKRYNACNFVVSQVVFRQLNSDGQFVLLDKGSRHGITKDMVAVYKNNLLGKITEVFPLYSKLVLLSDRSCKVAAHCPKTKASGIHAGLNDSFCCELQRVSHLDTVQEGDLVFSSGEGLVFPRGFALGKIASVAPDGLYHAVTVKPIIDPQNLSYCCLIYKGEASV